MSEDKRYLKIDMNQSLKDLIIERWGCKVGKKLVCCFQNALAKGENKDNIFENKWTC